MNSATSTITVFVPNRIPVTGNLVSVFDGDTLEVEYRLKNKNEAYFNNVIQFFVPTHEENGIKFYCGKFNRSVTIRVDPA